MSDEKIEDELPHNLTKWQKFSRFVWNPKTRQFLGRTRKSWCEILGFYLAFWVFLISFFSVMMFGFFQTIDNNEPKWKLSESLIGANPGLGIRPTNPDSTIGFIIYNSNDEQSVNFWSSIIDGFLKTYEDIADNDMCDYGISHDKSRGCIFKNKLTVCKGSKGKYGFEDNKPCVFLKMNKIYGWIAQPYCKKEIEENAMQMPDYLRERVLNSPDVSINNNVWVSCSAAEPHANVTLVYDGHPGFPNYYYPYAKQNNYHSPLVAMQINNLPTGEKVKINCQLWAKNIEYDRQLRRGGTTFEIQSN